MTEKLLVYLFYYFIVSSLLRVFIVLLSINQKPRYLSEKRVRLTVNNGALLDFFHLLMAFFYLGGTEHSVLINNFFLSGVDLLVVWNLISLIYFSFCIVILCLIGRFSIFYLHHDPYYFKFFSLYYILQIALVLLVLTQSSESVFIGWELLGLSSVLLISFYEHNKDTLKNSLRVLAIYKLSDIIFYTSLIFSAAQGVTNYSLIENQGVIFGIMVACFIKSSLFPWTWLVNAMEGPTPSSALFYGGLATHTPIFICLSLLNDKNLLALNNAYLFLIYLMIITGIIISTTLSRQCNNAKNALAYASISQIGIIYLEIVMGFHLIALFHCIAHAAYRIFALLRTPSLLYQKHETEQNIKTLQEKKKWPPRLDRVNRYCYKFIYSNTMLPKFLMRVIDNFIGIDSNRPTHRTLAFFYGYGLIFLIFFEWIIINLLSFSLGFIDLFFILLSFFLSGLALYNKFSPKLFFLSLSLSIAIIVDLLLEKVLPSIFFMNYIYLLLSAYMIYISWKKRTIFSPSLKFNRRIKNDSVSMFIILLFGFSLVGIPGLITFFIWGYLQHYILELHPGVIVNGFVLLSINTLVFFRFYYSNYLGKEVELNKVKASLRE